MKSNLILVFLLFCIVSGYSQSSEKVKITTQKMGDGLYDFYAENPNFFPMQLELHFIQFDNMSANCELPYIGTVQPGKHLIFSIKRTFVDLPGGYNFEYSTRIGAFPVNPDLNYKYELPVPDGSETQAIGFDFINTRTPEKIAWGFKIDEGKEVHACRNGVVCQISEVQFRDSFRLGDNTITVLHPDDTFGKYELFEDSSMTVVLGDTINAGDVLGRVGVTKFTKIPHVRFSVYYVNARIDSINENKIKNIHTYLNPFFTDNSEKSFLLEADKSYVK